MKNNLHSVCYSAIIAYFLVFVPVLSFSQTSESKQKLDTFLSVAKDLFQKAELPGAGFSIVYNGESIYNGGFGYSSLEKKTPIDENSLFFIGSTTKAFTGFAAATLVDKEKLAWKKPIIHYLPDFTLSEPYVAQNIHLEDLFTHMSGLSRKDNLWLGKPITREKVYEQTKTLDFSHSFRDEWQYNNHAYVIIGKVLEKVSNTSWESLIENEIFKPLEMNSSYTKHEEFLNDSKHVTGYYRDGKMLQRHINSDNIGPAGAISSTPKDLSKWLKMLVNKGHYKGKQLISEEQYNYLMNPKGMSFTDTCSVKYYAIGWGGKQTHGKRTLIHSGAIAGNNARVLFSPEHGFGIFILTNQISDYKDILTDYAERIFITDDFERDHEREKKLISFNRFIQFQNLLLDYGMEAAKKYHEKLTYKDFEPSMVKLGESLLNAGYTEPALFVFELNVADNPNSIKGNDTYAKALLKNNNKSKAIKILKKLLELDPTNENTKKRLDNILKSKE